MAGMDLIDLLPVPADRVSCGLRLDLPKNQRRHDWQDAGTDIRHRFSGEYKESQIRICAWCGKDEGKSVT